MRFFAGVWLPSAGRSLAPVARRESYACPAVSQAIYFARLVVLLSVCVRARVYGLWCCLLFVFLWSDKKKQATAPQNVRGSVLTYSSEQLLVHLDDQDERMQRAVFAVLEVRVFTVFGVKFHVGHEQLGHPLTKYGVLNTVLQLFLFHDAMPPPGPSDRAGPCFLVALMESVRKSEHVAGPFVSGFLRQ